MKLLTDVILSRQNSILVVFDDNVTSEETGNITKWKQYHEEYFLPLNTLFVESQGTEFREVREQLKIEMEVTSEWGPWGICEVCGRPKDEGVRKRTGLCRIKLTQKGSIEQTANSDRNFLKTANAIACRSQLLGRLLPGISNRSRIVPNFIQIQSCEGTCNPDAEGSNKGWKAGKTSSFKYRKTFVLEENSHLTLVCPESTIDNSVVWKKKGKALKAGESVVPPKPEDEPRILVDTFNTLYLVGVRESEEGNYTCQVDDIRMQQIIVFVISKSRLLTQAFVRHMMYLGLILSLTLPCYCAGVVIACSRRRHFKNYQELREEEAERHRVVAPKLTNGILKRCFVCRSRGELGSCKDPFTINATQIETEKGVEAVPCASGWCGKMLETENPLKEEYGVATERMCLQRGPSDSEDRCAYVKWNFRRVLMCFCRGDLCNTSTNIVVNRFLLTLCVLTASRLIKV